MVNRKLLIELVRNRSALWNKRDNLYCNRDLKPKLWDEVASELGVTVEVARRHWQLLRDTFRKQFKRRKRLGLSKVTKSNWVHYNEMSFLSDMTKPRFASNYSASPDVQDSEDRPEECYFYIKSEVDVPPYNADDSTSEAYAQTEPKAFEEHRDYRVVGLYGKAEADDRLAVDRLAVDRLADDRLADDDSASAQNDQQSEDQGAEMPLVKDSLSVQPVKCQLLDASQNNQDEDDDLSFFKSLLPYLKTLRPVQKMKLRSTILNNVISALQEANPNDCNYP
ncbi:BESS motif [Nesidiocoris tenuis]|uniref:BESS motif n=1 Tax=Nesidiocoris tenuis TaxID=355587 RepID=A0ABN7ATX6_9HEMI|nr:BESS motif [Nesidiocoris tenuis]